MTDRAESSVLISLRVVRQTNCLALGTWAKADWVDSTQLDAGVDLKQTDSSTSDSKATFVHTEFI